MAVIAFEDFSNDKTGKTLIDAASTLALDWQLQAGNVNGVISTSSALVPLKGAAILSLPFHQSSSPFGHAYTPVEVDPGPTNVDVIAKLVVDAEQIGLPLHESEVAVGVGVKINFGSPDPDDFGHAAILRFDTNDAPFTDFKFDLLRLTDATSHLAPNTSGNLHRHVVANSGSPFVQTFELGIRVQGNDLSMYLNGVHIVTTNDPLVPTLLTTAAPFIYFYTSAGRAELEWIEMHEVTFGTDLFAPAAAGGGVPDNHLHIRGSHLGF